MLAVVVLCALRAYAQPAPSSVSCHPNGGWGAVWSPQGNRLAFLSSDDGLPAEAWVGDLEGKGFHRVTRGGAADLSWAADGRTLSYTTSRRGRTERWEVEVCSGRESLPAPRPGIPADSAQTPSPDGKSVAYTISMPKSRDLYLATGAAEAKQITADFTVGNVAWSPQGDRIAFDGLNPLSKGLPQVWLYDVATKRLAHVGSSGSYAPVWSPGGEWLAYTMLSPDRMNRIAIVSVEDILKPAPAKTKEGEPKPAAEMTHGTMVTGLAYQGDGMAWSPRGDVLAVAVRTHEGYELCLVKPDGGIAAKLSQPGLQFRFPAWSPDGSRLALEAVKTGASAFSEVWITDAAGKEWKDLTPSRPSYWALSPAVGGRLLFLGNANGTTKAWALQDHSDPSQGPAGLTSLPGTEGATAVSASPVGDRILVLKPHEIALLSYEGKPLGTLPLAGATQANWSPRGDRVAVGSMDNTGEETIKLLSVSAEGALAEVASAPGANPAWRPDGRAIAFARDNGLWRMEADGGTPISLATVAAAAGEEVVVLNPTWDRDGTRIAFAVARCGPEEWRQELWLLTLNGAAVPPPSELYHETVSTEYAFSPARWATLPTWTSDGRLLFASDWDGTPRVWSVRPDGSDLRGVTPPRSAWPALGADGLYFVRLDSDTPIWKVSADGSSLAPLVWKD